MLCIVPILILEMHQVGCNTVDELILKFIEIYPCQNVSFIVLIKQLIMIPRDCVIIQTQNRTFITKFKRLLKSLHQQIHSGLYSVYPIYYDFY